MHQPSFMTMDQNLHSSQWINLHSSQCIKTFIHHNASKPSFMTMHQPSFMTMDQNLHS